MKAADWRTSGTAATPGETLLDFDDDDDDIKTEFEK